MFYLHVNYKRKGTYMDSLIQSLLDSIGRGISNSVLGGLLGDVAPGLIAFGALGVIGGLLLVLSFILDGIFDALSFGDGPLSLTTIAAFVTVFGFTGLAATGAGASAGTAAVISAVVGLAGAFGSFVFSKSLRKLEAGSAEVEGFIGRSGTVVIAIKQGSLGEISTQMNGETMYLTARSESEHKVGSLVTILSVVNSNSVIVGPVESGDQ